MSRHRPGVRTSLPRAPLRPLRHSLSGRGRDRGRTWGTIRGRAPSAPRIPNQARIPGPVRTPGPDRWVSARVFPGPTRPCGSPRSPHRLRSPPLPRPPHPCRSPRPPLRRRPPRHRCPVGAPPRRPPRPSTRPPHPPPRNRTALRPRPPLLIRPQALRGTVGGPSLPLPARPLRPRPDLRSEARSPMPGPPPRPPPRDSRGHSSPCPAVPRRGPRSRSRSKAPFLRCLRISRPLSRPTTRANRADRTRPRSPVACRRGLRTAGTVSPHPYPSRPGRLLRDDRRRGTDTVSRPPPRRHRPFLRSPSRGSRRDGRRLRPGPRPTTPLRRNPRSRRSRRPGHPRPPRPSHHSRRSTSRSIPARAAGRPRTGHRPRSRA